MRDKKWEVLIVSHTHWDREWAYSWQEYRMILIDLVRELLGTLEQNKEFKYFFFDGQTCWLSDYLEIFPEDKERIKKLVLAGRLFIGPFYLQPDEFLVDGEAIIRNLMLGHSMAEEYGEVTRIGYLPDMRGHNSQMPQILQGFGIRNALISIGILGDLEINTTEFDWEAPDGSVVFTHIYPSYGNPILPENIEEAVKIIEFRKKWLKAFLPGRYWIFPDGADNRRIQSKMPEIVKEINALYPEMKIRQASLPEVFQLLRKEKRELSTHIGELLGGQNWLILDRFSSRILIKQENRKTQDMLIKWTEPFSTIAWLLGEEYQQKLLKLSWRYLLTNHFHDSIYGTHIDSVADDVMQRFKHSLEVSDWLTVRALNAIAERVRINQTEHPLLIFNPLAHSRTEVVNNEIYIPKEWGIRNFHILDSKGELTPYQINKIEETEERIAGFSDREFICYGKTPLAIGDRVSKVSISFLAENVPALGYKTYFIKSMDIRRNRSARLSAISWQETEEISWLVRASSHTAENDLIKITIGTDGSIVIYDKTNHVEYTECNIFEDGGDSGAQNTYSKPSQDELITSKGCNGKVSLLSCGPVESVHKVVFNLALPEGLDESGRKRAGHVINSSIICYVSLKANSPRVDIKTIVDNHSKDHRLRVRFASGINTEWVYVDSPFDVVKRTIKTKAVKGKFVSATSQNHDDFIIEDAVGEIPSKVRPQNRFVDVSNGKRGLALIDYGLPEYEVTEQGIIYLTLLRCVGWHGKKNIPETGVPTSPLTPTPGAQLQGKHVFHYAVIPHKGDWEEGEVHRIAQEQNLPMKVFQIKENTNRKDRTLDQEIGFFSVSPNILIVSAIKKAENRVGGVVLRLYNPTTKKIDSCIRSFFPIEKASFINLNEETLDNPSPVLRDSCLLKLVVGPKKIVTLSLKMK